MAWSIASRRIHQGMMPEAMLILIAVQKFCQASPLLAGMSCERAPERNNSGNLSISVVVVRHQDTPPRNRASSDPAVRSNKEIAT